MTSLSMEVPSDFSDFELLDANDAKIASAPKKKKKMISGVHFRRRVSVEEQRAQNTTESFEQGRLLT